jgi:hypothetical protein
MTWNAPYGNAMVAALDGAIAESLQSPSTTAYDLYNRQKLAQGQTTHAPIASQFFTEMPFQGHHREYTEAELRWMLAQLGQEVVHVELFDYSLFGSTELTGVHADNFRMTQADPSLRQQILLVAMKPRPGGVGVLPR